MRNSHAPAPALPDAALDRLRRASTATLSAVLTKLGVRNTFMAGVRPLAPEMRLAGKAYTLRYVPMREDLVANALGGRYDNATNPQRIAVESVGPGDVLVIDARGDVSAGTLGSILATRMRERGAAGLVTDGAFRDAAGIVASGLPAFGRGVHGAISAAAHFPVDVQLPIACGGVTVYPGDAVVGDADGVVIVPRQLVEEVSSSAAEQEDQEAFILARVQAGAGIAGLYPPGPDALAAFERWRDRRRSNA
jgi:regulator of RNase E activity RraA